MRSTHDDGSQSRRRLTALLPAPGWTPDQPAEPAGPAGWRDRLLVAPQGRALAWLLGAGLVVVLAAGYLLSRHPAAAPAAPPPALPAAPLPSPTAASIVVDVGGRVRHPGLVTLPQGARVADAIAAAGGALRPADVAAIDLAARVSDGQLLLIGVPGGVAGPAGGAASAGPIDLNSATADQLDALPGVGPVLAQRIVDWRQAHGGFRSVDDLQQVPGIGARKFSDLKALVSA